MGALGYINYEVRSTDLLSRWAENCENFSKFSELQRGSLGALRSTEGCFQKLWPYIYQFGTKKKKKKKKAISFYSYRLQKVLEILVSVWHLKYAISFYSYRL